MFGGAPVTSFLPKTMRLLRLPPPVFLFLPGKVKHWKTIGTAHGMLSHGLMVPDLIKSWTMEEMLRSSSTKAMNWRMEATG